MKTRPLKLREAHTTGANAASFCSILWDQKAEHLVTSSSSDPTISIHNALSSSTASTILRHHRDGVTALAISPNSTCLASGSVDHSVKLYKFPSGEFQTNITRFTLPIRTLAFNKSGSLLASAGDDDGIKLINTVDGSIARVLKGHKGPVTGLDFDPHGEFLASIDSNGTVIYWELQNGKIAHTLKGIAPNKGFDTSIVNVLRWSPDGNTLAVPGLRNDVVMYDRDTGEKRFALKGVHVQLVCFLAWAPNGKYMATASLDNEVLIWNVDQKLDIDRHKFDETISCIAWKPNGNSLAVIDVTGKYGVWESIVPSSMTSPTEGIPDSQATKINGVLLFDEEDEEEELDSSESLSDTDIAQESRLDSHLPSRKRLREKTFIDDDIINEELDDELFLPLKSESRKKTHKRQKESMGSGFATTRSTTAYAKPTMQEAFQPGSTPSQPIKRHFLCYNMIGCITTIQQDGYSHIEIDFHDTGRGPRVPSMTDYFGFTMASINENGSVFANPCKGDKNLSTLFYRPFSSWASNSEWSMRFEGEEVKVVALGCGWVAAVTSLNYLRIFTEGGLQKQIVSLDGPVVTASGCKDELAVVTHASDCLPLNEQMLEFRLFNVSNMTQPLKGRLPLTPGSHLTWFGFSEEGQLSSYDSKGVLRVFTSQYGGSWMPLFSAGKEKKAEENYWVVGLNSSKLFCIVSKIPELFPQVTPKPVLTLLDFSLPLASSDLGAESLESDLMLRKTQSFEVQKRIDDMASVGLDTTSLDDEAFDLEVAQDQSILKLIGACCNSDKFARASELMRLLTLEKSMRAAIKLVTKLKLPQLAERFSNILEERLLKEANEGRDASLTREDITFVNPAACSARIKDPEAAVKNPAPTLSAPKLSAPTFVKKAKTPEGSEVGKAENKQMRDENVKRTALRNATPATKPTEDEENRKMEKEKQELRRPFNPFLKATVK